MHSRMHRPSAHTLALPPLRRLYHQPNQQRRHHKPHSNPRLLHRISLLLPTFSGHPTCPVSPSPPSFAYANGREGRKDANQTFYSYTAAVYVEEALRIGFRNLLPNRYDIAQLEQIGGSKRGKQPCGLGQIKGWYTHPHPSVGFGVGAAATLLSSRLDASNSCGT